ncbi:MAG TPA: D-2-hydroxyacid dehydrogenase [Gemmatimonadaceae bacterium]|nr:D-2-hydroxyacid dehydrogenase [Gemmatimonadaceae bacterium]
MRRRRRHAYPMRDAAIPMRRFSNPGGTLNAVSRKLVLDLTASAAQWEIPPRALDSIMGAAPPGWSVHSVSSPTSAESDGGHHASSDALLAIRDAEVYVGYGFTPALFAAATKLRWVHSASAGVGSLLFPEIVRSDVVVTNSAGIYAVPIAEYVVGGILALLRGFDLAIAAQRERRWEKQPFDGAGSPLREMGEVRALIIGGGGIGGAIAGRLAALGSQCTAIRRRPELGPPAGCSRVAGPHQLDELLPLHNVLIIAAPATSETRGLVTGERLDRLSKAAIVVNVARGALLDEEALAERLLSGRLRGAVLDVFREEPLSHDSPLWAIPTAILTPHVAGVSPNVYWERQSGLLLENWNSYVRGEPLRNTVDKAAGY